jgi:hypothetical protein
MTVLVIFKVRSGTYQVNQVLQCRKWLEDFITHTIQAIHSKRPVMLFERGSRAKKSEEERKTKNEEPFEKA